ncbi:cupin domain-containing protein [Clostridioides difficile]|uniref:cupin domain-containing protein n=1 Tax=Clostridioides difficile TaxID=1496 RepID=UPI000B079C7D|nr:cupin domain-containing protein [Clostridioides difficile]MCK3749171.1 cupin domain-containing protein [Clostridioides difficile]MCP8398293.1 cupin domain-containing protein [Clostridioides difficile]MCP8417366.1 cupin domain-containing protein [Clostridioides difficile]MCP8494703.1 cupin domain-containing protein [Clostridioides difficile]MCP8657900.1 cupin domain-containing protein [Clostridioides difficile]
MSLTKLFQSLYIYNESELFYKNYYFAKQNPESLKLFIHNLNEDYIVNNNLIIPYIYNEKIPQFMHEHIFFEMIYVLSGKCHQIISHHSIHMKEGDICIVSPGVKHSIGVFDDSIIINVLIRRSTF